MLTPRAVGVLAHVDAGKTTLCEQLLYRAGVLRRAGRVDHGDTALDTDDIERTRGITVFANQACFTLADRRVTLLDTPGHADFAAETERALYALDMAVLVLDACADVPAHASALFALLRAHGVPTVLFLNKTDLPGYDERRALARVTARLTPRTVVVRDGVPDYEQLSLLHDGFMEAYLNGTPDAQDAWRALGSLLDDACPVLTGAALGGVGVDELLAALPKLFAALDERDARNGCLPDAGAPLRARVYQVRHAPGGERVCYLRIENGTLRPRDVFRFGDSVEKVNQLRLYQGEKYSLTDAALPGDRVGVTGLNAPVCGALLLDGTMEPPHGDPRFAPVLSARVEPPEGVSSVALLEKLRMLEDEDPLLHVLWDEAHGVANVQVMGAVQTEVLTQLLQNRFGLAVRFLPPLVLYKETIAAPVVGCGHYEPLRHYAEAHLLLSPAPRGSGVSFDSRCHVDDLPAHFQSLIRTHVLEKAHRGVLTGSPLTDVQVTLLSGRAHLKHTEGGDFREAVYRAIRQGLRKAQSVLLEPFYRFALTVPQECLGRAMTDITALCGSYDAPEPAGDEVYIHGRGPVRTFLDYATQVRAYTHGRGSIAFQADGYDLCHDPDAAVAACAYDPGADKQNPAGSVFCSHGAGYYVPWDEADAKMHLPVEQPS